MRHVLLESFILIVSKDVFKSGRKCERMTHPHPLALLNNTPNPCGMQLRQMKTSAKQASDAHMEKVAALFMDVEDIDEDDVSELVFDDLIGRYIHWSVLLTLAIVLDDLLGRYICTRRYCYLSP